MVSRRKGEGHEEFLERQRQDSRKRYHGGEKDYRLKRAAERYATDPEFRQRQLARVAAWQRQARLDPEYCERENARSRAAYAADPDHYRQYYSNYQRERYATDPEYRAKVLARQSERYYGDRSEIAEAEAWQCWLCGEAIDREARHPDPLALHVDHMLPVSKGGKSDPANLAPAHAYCNISKNDRLVADVELPPDLLARARALRNTNDEEAA